MKSTPLDIATQEYAYWRSFDLKPEKAAEFFSAVLVGAIGAAANICSRLAGHEFEGIAYKMLSPAEITRVLNEIRMAPRMATLLTNIQRHVRNGPEELSGETMDEISEVLRELETEDVVKTRGVEPPRER